MTSIWIDRLYSCPKINFISKLERRISSLFLNLSFFFFDLHFRRDEINRLNLSHVLNSSLWIILLIFLFFFARFFCSSHYSILRPHTYLFPLLYATETPDDATNGRRKIEDTRSTGRKSRSSFGIGRTIPSHFSIDIGIASKIEALGI